MIYITGKEIINLLVVKDYADLIHQRDGTSKRKKLNEKFKSHFSFNKYASRKKRFNGEPETIEDYLKRGGTVTKLKDEPEILLEIEMMQ